MSWIINIVVYIFAIPYYIFWFIKEIIIWIVDIFREPSKKRSLTQKIIEKFQNYDNLSEEEREDVETIDIDDLKEAQYETLSKIVRSWFDKKLLDDDRCQFIGSTLESTSLLKKLIDEIEKIPFSEKDYTQLICVYRYIYSKMYFEETSYTLKCAEYIRRYWNESGVEPLPVNNDNVNLNYYRMAKLSLKELTDIKENRQGKEQIEPCYYITKRLELFTPKRDANIISVTLSLFADRLEIYKCNDNDVIDENGNIVLKKGKSDTIKLEEIDDIRFNNWDEVAYSSWRSSEIMKLKCLIEEYKDDKFYEKQIRQKEDKLKRLEEEKQAREKENGEALEDKYLLNIYCVDGRKYSFSDAREPDILIIRALLLYFIQKTTRLHKTEQL